MKNEQALQKFSEMMIERMEQLQNSDWHKGWFSQSVGCYPTNLSGRAYNGANSLLLFFLMQKNEYKLPIFATFNQVTKLKAHIRKGEHSFPVFFWKFSYVNKNDRSRVSEDAYNEMSDDEKDDIMRIPMMQTYSVFNIAQTTLEEDAPEFVAKLKRKLGICGPQEMPTDTFGMYENAAIDEMLSLQTWFCPIHYEQQSNICCYRPKQDDILIPLKAQFRTGTTDEEIYECGQEYYSSLIHEMVHSTGHSSRLNRNLTGSSYDDYAEEELVAELSAALIGNILGFSTHITDNNAAYLNSWIKQLKKEPKYILHVMTKVNQASRMVMSKIAIEQSELTAAI